MKIIIIGSSTGGPFILEQVFSGLPRIHAAILIVQHLPPEFNLSFRNHIAALTSMDVTTAGAGIQITESTIYLAPAGTHMMLGNNRFIFLTDGERVHGVKPAVDCTMRSLKARVEDSFMGIVLTGMGQDGAAGIVHMQKLGAITVAQDPKTAPIASMPQSAIDTGKVTEVLPPDLIKKAIIKFGTE